MAQKKNKAKTTKEPEKILKGSGAQSSAPSGTSAAATKKTGSAEKRGPVIMLPTANTAPAAGKTAPVLLPTARQKRTAATEKSTQAVKRTQTSLPTQSGTGAEEMREWLARRNGTAAPAATSADNGQGTGADQMRTWLEERKQKNRRSVEEIQSSFVGGGGSFDTVNRKNAGTGDNRKLTKTPVTTPSGYYDRPDFNTSRLETYSRQADGWGKKLEEIGGQRTQRQRELEGMAAEIRWLQQEQIPALQKAAQEAGSLAEIMAVKNQEDRASARLDALLASYTTGRQELESIDARYGQVLESYNTAVSGFENEYAQYRQGQDEWRKTVRTDRDAIQKDLDAAAAALQEATRNRTIIENRLNALSMEQITPETAAERAALEAQLREAQRAERKAQEQERLLRDERDYSTYFDFESYRERADFAEKSKYRADVEDRAYRIANKDSETMENAKTLSSGNVSGLSDKETVLQQMTDDEVAMYNYLYATDPEKAQEYIDWLTRSLNARNRRAEEEKLTEFAKSSPWARMAMSAASVPARFFGAPISFVGQTIDYLKDGEIDQNAPYNSGAYIPTAIRGAVAKEVEKKWGKPGSYIYQTAMSLADFTFAAAMTGNLFGGMGNATARAVAKHASLALMASDVAADTVVRMKDRGLSDEQSYSLGLIAGAAEYFSEMVSLETLLDKTSMGENYGGYILKNFIAEGSEEVVSDFINLFAEVMIAQDESEWRKKIEEYRRNGMSRNAAFGEAFADQLGEMGLSFLGGAISGGIMGGAAVVIDMADTRHYGAVLNETESEIRADAIKGLQDGQQVPTAMELDGVTRGLIETGLSAQQGTEARDYAEAMLEKAKNGEKITNYEMGRMARLNERAEANGDLQEESEYRARQEQERRRAARLGLNENAAGETAAETNRAQADLIPARDEAGGVVLPTAETQRTVLPTAEYSNNQAENLNTAQSTAEYSNNQTENMNAAQSSNRQVNQEVLQNGAEQRTETQAAAELRTEPAAEQDGRIRLPGGERAGDVSDRDGGRVYGTSTRGQAGVLAEGTEGARERSADAGRAAAGRATLAESVRSERVNVREALGVRSAAENATVRVIAQQDMTPELARVYANNYKQTGKKTTFTLDPIRLANGRSVNAVNTKDGMIVQANHVRYSPEQLSDHEMMHDFIREDAGLRSAIRDAILENYVGDEYRAILEEYVRKHRGVYDLSELSEGEAQERLDDLAEEELFCDAYAGMNKFAQHAERYQETVRGTYAERGNPVQRSRQNAAAMERTNGPGAARYSIEEIDGQVMPVIDTEKDTREFSAAENYLKALVDTDNPFATILYDAQPVYIGKDLPGEYRGSEYTKSMRSAIRSVKMQAATNLNEMLLLAENGEWRENVKDKHAIDAMNGWYRYDTTFAAPSKNRRGEIDHYTVYDGTLLIRNDADGKSYLYDLIDLKEKKKVSSSSTSTRENGSAVFEPVPSSESTVPQTETESNRKFEAMAPENMLPGGERYSTEGTKERFSMEEPVEETADLVALHNLNAEKLGKALDIGGFPMPSIAVTKTSIPHTNFGDITLIMDKTTVDPEFDRRNTTYSADAWTPTFPRTEYEIAPKAASRLRSKYYDLYRRLGDDATRALYPYGNYAEDELNRRGGEQGVIDYERDNVDMMKLYLQDTGAEVPEPVYREDVSRIPDETIQVYDHMINAMGAEAFREMVTKDGQNPMEARREWWAAHRDDYEAAYKEYLLGLGFSQTEVDNVMEQETLGSMTRVALGIRNYLKNGPERRSTTLDTAATNDAIRNTVDPAGYDAWLHELFDGIEKSSGIYNGKERYTPSGDMRSFAATHLPVTLENIAKAMAAENGGNSKNTSGFYGVKSLRAATATEFRSIDEMHRLEGRLQHLTEEEAEQITETLSDRMMGVMQRIYDTKPKSRYDNSFIDFDHIGEIMAEAADRRNVTVSSIQKAFSGTGYTVDAELAQDIKDLFSDIAQMPVNIFEAKPKRAVRFDEVLAAVVPDDTDPALISRLQEAGVRNVMEYERDNNDDRLEKVNSVPEARFSVEDEETEPEEALPENTERYSVTDPETLEFLENQETETVYRAMQVIDGELYPPMAARVRSEDGKKALVEPSVLGEWEQATERPDLIRNGNKFELDKANGSSISAAYNPYFHTSRSPLNDQFSSAYKRPNIVIVEGEIPSSELTSGYKAQYAKDPVGEMKWHSGPVSSKLPAGKERRVILSRWFKPTRIVSDAEVAGVVRDMLEGENIEIPYKVVTPGLRAELEKLGVPVTGESTERFSVEDDSTVAERFMAWSRENPNATSQEAGAELRRIEREQQRESRKAKQQETEKPPKLTKPPQESRPIIAKRELRQSLERIFSIPSGMKKSTGDFIDQYADKLLKKGSMTMEDRETFFNHMYETGVVEETVNDAATYGRSLLKGRKFYVNDTVREELGDDWNEWRKRAMAAGFWLTNDQSDPGLDMANQELSEIMPGLFNPDDTDLTNMLQTFVQVAEEGKAEQMPLAEYVASIAEREYVSEDEVIRDYQQQMERELDKFAEKANLEVYLRDRTGIKIAEERAKYQEALAREREKYRTRRAMEQADRQAAMEQARERRDLREMQQRTLRTLKQLKKMRNKTAPELQPMIDQVLGDLDLYAIGAANELRYSKRYDATWGDIAEMYAAYKQDEDFIPNADLERIMQRVMAPKIGDMTVEDLQDRYNAAVGLLQNIYNRNRLLADEYGALISEVTNNAAEDIRNAPIKGGEETTLGKIFNTMQLTPMNMLERMAGWNPDSDWMQLARKLEDGERKRRKYIADSQGYLADAFVREHSDWVKKADGQGRDAIWYQYDAPEITGWNEGNKPIFSDKKITVWFTPAQKVHMALESKNIDNLRHMMGGRTFPNKELYSKGKTQEAFAQGTTVKLDPATVRAMVSSLTPEEQALYDALEPFYNQMQKVPINETSMILNGYEKATEANYAPIFTNKNYTKSEPGIFDMTAEGIGSLKERVVSFNPSYQISAFDAFDRSVKQAALYIGMAIPVRDMNAVLNKRTAGGESMKDVITHKWSNKQLAEVEDLLTELQGGRQTDIGSIEKMTNSLLNKYISATFGFNPSIVLKQSASFPLAGAYLGIRNMPNLAKALRVSDELINTYTGELAYRTLGYATPETAELKKNPNRLQQSGTVGNFIFGGGAITWMDGVTVKTMWSWAENKVRREQPDLDIGTQEEIDSGSSPFYRAVAREFNEAVSRSQPMYDTMHRAEIMREGGALNRTFTLFKTVPMQEYNMIRQAIGEAQYYKKTGADSKTQRAAARKVGSVYLSIATGNLMIGAITLANALLKNKAKKYRDDDDELTTESVMLQFARQWLQDGAGIMLFGDTAAEIIGNILTGDKWYGLETPGIGQLTSILEQTIKAGSQVKQLIIDGLEMAKDGGDFLEYLKDNYQVYLKAAEDVARTVGTYATGLPIDNLRAYLLGAIKWISPEINVAYEDAVSKAKKAGLSGLTGQALEMRMESVLEQRLGDLGDVDENIVQELSRLYEAGYPNAVPSAEPEKITINSEEHELSIAQQQQYGRIWSQAIGDSLKELVGSMEYQQADEETRAAALQVLYAYGHEQAKEALFPEYKPETSAADRAMAAGATLAEWAMWSKTIADMDTSEKYEALLESGYDDDTKIGLIGGMMQSTEEKTDAGNLSAWGKMQSILDSGLDVDQYIELKNAGAISAYMKNIENGLNAKLAYNAAMAIKGMDPEGDTGKAAKWRIMLETSGDQDEQIQALSTVMYDSEFEKLQLADSFGFAPEVSVILYETLPSYDLDGNGSYKQDEYEAAIDAMSGGDTGGIMLPGGNTVQLTNEERAALWQIWTGSKSAKNNPYDTDVGQAVIDARAG